MKRDTTGKFVNNWDSEKKQRVSISLTSTAWRLLDREAHKQGISRSEAIERFARSLENGANAQAVLQERILEQQQALETLQRQKQELEALLENAPDAIARFDAQIRYLYVNPVVEQALGLSRDALLGKTMSEFMSDPIYRFWEEHLLQVFATAQEQEIEFEFETPFGVRFYQARLVPELDAEGTPISVVVISRDITETRQAQQQHTQLLATQETERKVITILESITDAFVAFDRNWHYTYVNQAAAQILHKTPEELIGKHVWNEVFPNEVGSIAYQELHRAVAEQMPVSWEELGQPIERWLEVNAYPSAEGVAVYFRDVTERKQAEAERERLLQELETERTRFEAVLRQMPAGVMIADAASGKLALANEQAKQIVGYAYEQLLDLNEYDPVVSYIPLRSNGQLYAHEDMPLARSLLTGEIVTNEEMEIHRDDGSRIFININSAPILDNQGQIVAAVVIFQDVTERKLVEQALRENESRLRGLVDANLIGIIIGDFQGNILEVNDAWLGTLGYTRQEVLSGDVNFLEITPPQFRHLDRQAMAEMKRVGRHTPFEKEYIRKDGTRVPVLIGTAYLGGPNDLGVGFLIDLTERKRLESKLRQREQQFKMVVENAPDIISRINAEFRYLYTSPSIELATGIPSEQFIGKTSAELGIPEDIYSVWYDSWRQVFETKQEQIIEFSFPTPKGIRWYQSRIVPEFASDGSVETVLSIARDVTDYKQVEQALRESEERLRLALAAAQIVGWDMDLTTNRVICSANALSVWGIQEGTGEDFFAIVHPDERQRVMQAAQAAIAGGEQPYKQEYRVIGPDGVVRWLNSQGRVYLDATGRGVRMIGVSVDITERKQMEAQRDRLLKREQAARRSAESERKRLHDILMQFPAMIGIVTGPDLVYEFANPTYLQVAGRTPDIIGKSMRDVFPELEGQIYFDVLKQVYRTGEPFIRDESPAYWDRKGDGVLEEAFFNCVVFPVWRDAEGTIQGVLIYNTEVTEQVRARQQIEQLLENLQHKERQQQFLIELNDTIRAIGDPKEVMWQVVRATGQHFNVTRCTYGQIDPTQEYVIVVRDYCNGVISVVGSHHMDSFGPEIIAQLKQGKTLVVDDVDTDPRTAGSGAAAFDAIQTKSLLCVPLVKEGRFVALFVLHHVSPRHWTEGDVALIEQIAEQTWLAVERSRAEEALRTSEARLQLALMVGRMGTWDWDMQMNTVTWSEGHFTIMGLQPNECEPSYELWAKSVHPDDLVATEAALQQAMLERTEYYHEYRMLWADDSVHWTEARGKFTYNLEGQPTRMIGVVIDITERKQAEQEREQLLERERIARTQVEAAQQQLATIFETSPVGIALLDAKQRFIAINEALAEINGLTREQHLGHSIPELFGQSDPELVELFHQIYTTGDPFISPNFAVNVPGRSDRRPGYYNVYYLPTTNQDAQVEDVLVYVVDVTERVRLERAQHFLSEASAVLASSLDYQTTLERVAQLTVPELADWCTVHMVEEGAIEQIALAHANPAKLEWADQIKHKAPLNPDDPRGAAFTLRTGQSDLIPDIPDELLVEAARDPEHLEILRQVGFRSVMTVPLRTQTRILGVMSFVSAQSGRQYNQIDLQLAEELARRASLAIDNAQLYREAQRDRAKAEAANRVKDEFLAVLSHELRSPLNPILGWTKMLRAKRLDPTKTEQALETIERNAKLQAQLIEDLLDVSRILQGKMMLNVVPVNLAATIEAALETVRLAAEAKGIQIQTALNSVSGTVLGDPNRLQQVFWNLLSNAVKFTPTGGSVEVRLEQIDTYAQIQVKDTGRGISPEFLPHVFEYFRQEDGTTTRQFGGLGLGLAIVRHLTELHGGTVGADSPGQNLGATFTVRLPLNVVEQELSFDGSHSESVTQLTGIHILVVDDDADMRELAAFILKQSGAQVTTVASAAEALSLLNPSVPDLLLCDIGMPEMDGYSLIRLLRKRSPQQGGTIPAIALTAYAGEINQQQALAAGFGMHISKPVEPEKLVQAIAQLLHLTK